MFKNLTFFALSDAEQITKDSLRVQLESHQFVPRSKHQPVSCGWDTFADGSLVLALGDQLFARMKTEAAILPASVVNKEVSARAVALEKDQGFPATRKQRRELREAAIHDLLATAYSKEGTVTVWISPVNGWVGIDAIGTKADALIDLMLISTDDFSLRRVATNNSPEAKMSYWLSSGDEIDKFTIDMDCAMKSHDGATVRFTNHSLDSDAVRSHVEGGKLLTMLGMTHNNHVSFRLTNKMELKRLVFDSALIESANIDSETTADVERADLLLTAVELSSLLPDLIEALGGLRYE